ncbi:hypothetical protein EV137_6668 [Kribbella pratensis]|uniref:Uncharacterized protein n=1 Tax=Kribbella pratensis TaxID=2512112 RepID=A0ABY2F682_9ACTN|nr:hypothetical protein EV137_6668 [Kribbella pratensis]TDW92401.1 hypothetical protein EV647_4239 [Kribbella sp. VKM Ac-2566]
MYQPAPRVTPQKWGEAFGPLQGGGRRGGTQEGELTRCESPGGQAGNPHRVGALVLAE